MEMISLKTYQQKYKHRKYVLIFVVTLILLFANHFNVNKLKLKALNWFCFEREFATL